MVFKNSIMDTDVTALIMKFCKIADQKDEDSAFLILDIDDILEKVQQWNEKMPRVEPYYAMKCNDDPVLLRILAALNFGFDCASKVEIETIVNLGVPPDRIVYANTCKGISHLRRAADLKVEMMTFDSEDELLKIKQHCPSANFHVGCQVQDPEEYATAITLCRRVFDAAERKGIIMQVLDIGGGFPGALCPQNRTGFDKIARAVNQAIEKHFPQKDGIKIIAEPGRYFAASAFTLCTKIIGKKRRFIDNEENIMYFINEGVFGLFNQTIYHDAVPIIKELSQGLERKCSSIWGQSCDPEDIIIKKCMLPELHVGDWIVFEEMGAYTTACASTFNGFEKACTKIVASKKTLSALEKIAGSKLSETLRAEIQLKENVNKMN